MFGPSPPPRFRASRDLGIYYAPDYGVCDPTGTVDSSTAIQAALTACAGSLYGGTVVIPPGRYLINTALTWGGAPYDAPHGWGYRFGRTLQGAGRGATVLEAGSGLAAPILSVTSTTAALPSVTVRDIGFNANAQTSATGLKITNCVKALIDNVLIMGAIGGSTLATKGLHLSGVLKSQVRHLEVKSCVTGIYTDAGNYGSNQLDFIGVESTGCSTYAVHLTGGSMVNIYGGDFETNGTAGSASTGAIKVATGSNSMVSIHDIWIEGTANGAVDITSDCGSLLVDGVHYVPTDGDVDFLVNTGTATLKRVKTPGSVGPTIRANNTGGTLRLEDCVAFTVSGNAATTWH